MTISDERLLFSSERSGYRIYEPDILPRLQSLLATLADLDVVHASNVSTIEGRQTDIASKQRVIADLRQSHRERCLPYILEIEALRARMDAAFG
ncbi:hypothetical protein MHY87_10925 [Microvirga sp. ACRRW]|uniref:hypothetical protein n=1 Tax=Microvirga sp. ACRRW TaxID=2918205 RepID=UPI001EF7352E|nr:hypothetical protein [Microvirga sp. ACRRW]MCG7393418.1 hypothetical protein [Microvirga sp. ACRRW]